VSEKFPESSVESAIEAVMAGQLEVYSVTTFESTFKHVMQDPEVCLEFVKKIARNDKIQSVTLLDGLMNLIKELTNARTFLNCPNNLRFKQQCGSDGIEIYIGLKSEAKS
jgi:hypothetical protein